MAPSPDPFADLGDRLRTIGDRRERVLARALVRIFDRQRASADNDLFELVLVGAGDQALRPLAITKAAEQTEQELIAAILYETITDALADDQVLVAVRALGFEARLDLVNARAWEWATEQAASLVTAVDGETVAAIRQTVAAAVNDGMLAGAVERIRSVIGLTRQQARALERFRDSIPGSWSPKRVARAVARRARRLLAERAKTIGRTETMRSLNAGLRLMFEDLAAQGHFAAADAWVYWITTPDERLCERCAPMTGVRVPLVGGVFVSDTVGIGRELSPAEAIATEQPPLHPRCRCTLGLDYSTTAALAQVP